MTDASRLDPRTVARSRREEFELSQSYSKRSKTFYPNNMDTKLFRAIDMCSFPFKCQKYVGQATPCTRACLIVTASTRIR